MFARWIRASLVGALAAAAAWADPPAPDALLEPRPDHVAALLELQSRSEADAEAVLIAVEMKLYGLFAAAPSGGLMIDYVRAQWAAMATLPDPVLRARGAVLIASACDGAYLRTLNLESNIPVEICEWTRDPARRDDMVQNGRVIP